MQKTEDSIPGPSSAPSIFDESGCMDLGPSHSVCFSPIELPLLQPSAHQCSRQVPCRSASSPADLPALPLSSIQVGCWGCFQWANRQSHRQTDWPTGRPPGRPPDLVADLVLLSALKFLMLVSKLPVWPNAQLFLWSISVNHFHQFSLSLTFYQLPSLVRARVPSHAHTPRGSICSHSSYRLCMSSPLVMLWVTLPAHSHIHNLPQGAAASFQRFSLQEGIMLLICFCYATSTFHSVGIPRLFGRVGGIPPFSRGPCSVPPLHYLPLL